MSSGRTRACGNLGDGSYGAWPCFPLQQEAVLLCKEYWLHGGFLIHFLYL
jgi:hypothetical protein